MIAKLFAKRPGMLFSALLLAGLSLLLAAESQATIMRYLEVEDLSRISSDVFSGQVLSTRTYWNQERTKIFTAVEVQIQESFKGTAQAGEVVTITQLGGTKDGVTTDFVGRPDFAVGESVVLFTTRRGRASLYVVALKQGKMRVEGEEVVRDFSGVTLVDKAGGQIRPMEPKRRRYTMRELRRRIAAVK